MRARLIVVIMSCVAGCAPRMSAPASEPAAAGEPRSVAIEPDAKDETRYVLRDAAAGVYTIGCGVAKGADCILDGNVGVGGTELYVGRYNKALEGPERTNVPREREPEPEVKKRALSVQLTPFGASGTF